MKHTLIVLLTLSLFGCANNTPKCEYYEGFSFYMQEEHQIAIASQKAIYYVMPMTGCEPCIASNLEMLATIPKIPSLTIIFIGTSEIEQYNAEAEMVKTKHAYIEDMERAIFSYETNIGKPLMIHVDNGNCVVYREIKDTEVAEAKKYLMSQNE